MSKNGISALQLCGALMVVEDYFLQTAITLILAKNLQAENCLGFPCLSIYLQAQVGLTLPALTCLFTH